MQLQTNMRFVIACTGLAASEVRAVVIQKRSLVFFCGECREAFKSAPALIRQIQNMEFTSEYMKKEVDSLRFELNQMAQHRSTKKDIEVLRVGKPGGTKPRPLKVVCSSSEVVRTVMVAMTKLLRSPHEISADQTKIQQENPKTASKEVRDRQEKEEVKLTLTYGNGTPMVNKKQESEKKTPINPFRRIGT
ncbi:hypothetical protein JTB14_026433 [Gonioctena quinquepunctata]|nr:hypothetical protein JTB14_026433 [Gonioctena quinquepunctata]